MPTCKCCLCGEELTAPEIYNGSIYGYSCVKKVQPNYKKLKNKAFLVKADSFTVDKKDEFTAIIKAAYNGLNFTAFITYGIDILGNTVIRTNGIILQQDCAYINLLDFNKSNKVNSMYLQLRNRI